MQNKRFLDFEAVPSLDLYAFAISAVTPRPIALVSSRSVVNREARKTK
jgi:hypothetical protein